MRAKVFWFFFSKKNRLRAGLAGRPRAKEKISGSFLKKRTKKLPFIQAALESAP
jgi:hypothetical protein